MKTTSSLKRLRELSTQAAWYCSWLHRLPRQTADRSAATRRFQYPLNPSAEGTTEDARQSVRLGDTLEAEYHGNR